MKLADIFHFRGVWILVVVFLNSSAVSYARAGDAPLTLQLKDIIENVRANEQLYDNLDVQLKLTYMLAQDPLGQSMGAKGSDLKMGDLFIFSSQQMDVHCVRQDGLFRIDRQGKATSGEDVFSLDRIRAFDGTTTRLLDAEQVGNIIDGRSEDENVIRPHMLLLRFMQFMVPLSTYLSGHEAMQAYPGANWQPDHKLEVVYKGEEELDGLSCHEVWVTTIVNGSVPYHRWEIRLAEERNYIPVRIHSYTFRISKTVAAAEGRVKSWQELASGIWYPVETSFTAFDEAKVAKTGKQETSWQENTVSDTISLSPKYDLAYFRDVPFKDGVSVYEVNRKKEIIKSYAVGAPNSPGGPTSQHALTRWWFVSANIIVVAFLIIMILRRRAKLAAG